MKTFLVIRHAKSSWATVGQKDFDRPLNDRGKRDAPAMAVRLLQKNIAIDTFVSSPAKRASMTCKAFVEIYKRAPNEIIFIDALYHAPSPVFYEVIASLDNSLIHVAIFAHNPGISEFADSLCKEINIFDMPTCGVFAVSAEIDAWADFEKAKKKFLFFEKP